MDADKKRIWVSGQTIEVTDAVYEAYMKGDRKMRYFENDLKAERILLDEDGQIKQIILSREDSLDRLISESASGLIWTSKMKETHGNCCIAAAVGRSTKK